MQSDEESRVILKEEAKKMEAQVRAVAILAFGLEYSRTIGGRKTTVRTAHDRSSTTGSNYYEGP